MNEGYKVLRCGKLYVKEIVFDGFDKLASLHFSESVTNAKRIHLSDQYFDGIENSYPFITVRTITITEE